MIFLIPIPVIWLVVGVYFLINYIHYRYVKLERFCEAKLERVVRNGAYGLVGFMFETEVNGMRIETETKKVFSAEPFHPNKIENYSCRTVKLGFDPKRSEYIVV